MFWNQAQTFSDTKTWSWTLTLERSVDNLLIQAGSENFRSRRCHG